MPFYRLAKLAIENAASAAAQQYGLNQPPPASPEDPSEQLAQALQNLNESVKPYWLQEEKKRYGDSHDISWGPPTPLHAGDTAERQPGMMAALGMRFGGV